MKILVGCVSWIRRVAKRAYLMIKKNLVFILFNVIMVIIIAAGIKWSYLGAPSFLERICNHTRIGTMLQVTTTLVGIFIAVIAVSFTAQDTRFIGVAIRDLRKLRARWQYSLRLIIIIPLVLSLINLICFLSQLYYVCISVSLTIILFCIHVCWTEIPLLAKVDAAGIGIIKESIINTISQDEFLQEVQDKALAYMLTAKNLKTTYEKLKTEDKGVNARIVRKILDVQATVASEIPYYAEKLERVKTVDALFGNVQNALFHDDEFVDVLPEEEWVNFGALINQLSRYEESKWHLDGFVSSVLSHLDYNTRSKEKERILILVLVYAVVTSVKESRYNIIKSICRYYRDYSYVFEDGLPSSKVYGLLSLYFYYLCVLEGYFPADMKEEVQKVINSDSNTNYETIYGWTHFFHHYLETPIEPISEFFSLFKLCMRHMEYFRLDGEAKFVIMDYSIAFEWFITRIIARRGLKKIDYEATIDEEDNKVLHELRKLHRECFDEEKEFHRSEYMNRILEFFNANNHPLHWFDIEEGQTHALFEFLNRRLKSNLKQEISGLNRIDDQELSNDILNGVNSYLCEQWGYKNFQGELKNDAHMRIPLHKVDAYNLKEILVEATTRRIMNRVKSLLKFEEAAVESIDELINLIRERDIKYVTAYAKETMPYVISDPEKRNDYHKLMEEMTIVNSGLIPPIAFIDEKAFCYDIQIDRVEVSSPARDEIIASKDNYKRVDGQYIYEGVFVEEEELMHILEETVRFLNIDIKYSVEQGESAVVTIDFENCIFMS